MCARIAEFLPVALALTLVLASASLLALPAGRAASAPPNQPSETRIEIRVAGDLSAAQKAQIGELLKAFEGQNPRLKIEAKAPRPKGPEGPGKEKKEKESKADKYLFFPLTAAMLGTVAVSTVLAQGWRRTRYGINLIGNVATAVAFALVAASGVLLILNVELEDSGLDVKFWHVVIGTVFVYLIVFHLVNNWRAWLAYLRRVARWLRLAGP